MSSKTLKRPHTTDGHKRRVRGHPVLASLVPGGSAEGRSGQGSRQGNPRLTWRRPESRQRPHSSALWGWPLTSPEAGLSYAARHCPLVVTSVNARWFRGSLLCLQLLSRFSRCSGHLGLGTNLTHLHELLCCEYNKQGRNVFGASVCFQTVQLAFKN